MSKYSCDMIQDLLALYHDGVCSEDSREAVEQHLAQCEKCSAVAKLLDNTELESSVSEQAEGVIKNHRNKQRRKMIIIIAAAIAVLLFVVFFWVIKPRIEMNNLICEFLPEVGESAEYFTKYDIADDGLVMTDIGDITIGMPADFELKDTNSQDIAMYRDKNNINLGVTVNTTATELEGMSLFYRDSYDVPDEEYELITKHLTEWFNALGNGLPDSAYNTYKCMYLLSDDDRSFWDIGQNIAFGITGILRESIPAWGEEIYIYETDDKCGFVHVSYPTDTRECYRVTVDLYSTDDLNAPYTVMINSESLEEAYAIVNSIAIK